MKIIKYKIFLATVILSLIFLASLLLRKFSAFTGTICLIRGTIGIPCPSCGMTRAIREVFSGDIINAFRFHPLFYLPFVSIVLVYLNKRLLKIVLIITIILLISVYLFRMKVYFPNIEPMNMNEKAILIQFGFWN